MTGETPEEIIYLICHATLHFPSNPFKDCNSEYTSHARDLISKLLSRDPRKRPSATEALSHAFFSIPEPPPPAISPAAAIVASPQEIFGKSLPPQSTNNLVGTGGQRPYQSNPQEQSQRAPEHNVEKSRLLHLQPGQPPLPPPPEALKSPQQNQLEFAARHSVQNNTEKVLHAMKRQSGALSISTQNMQSLPMQSLTMQSLPMLPSSIPLTPVAPVFLAHPRPRPPPLLPRLSCCPFPRTGLTPTVKPATPGHPTCTSPMSCPFHHIPWSGSSSPLSAVAAIPQPREHGNRPASDRCFDSAPLACSPPRIGQRETMRKQSSFSPNTILSRLPSPFPNHSSTPMRSESSPIPQDHRQPRGDALQVPTISSAPVVQFQHQ